MAKIAFARRQNPLPKPTSPGTAAEAEAEQEGLVTAKSDTGVLVEEQAEGRDLRAEGGDGSSSSSASRSQNSGKDEG